MLFKSGNLKLEQHPETIYWPHMVEPTMCSHRWPLDLNPKAAPPCAAKPKNIKRGCLEQPPIYIYIIMIDHYRTNSIPCKIKQCFFLLSL